MLSLVAINRLISIVYEQACRAERIMNSNQPQELELFVVGGI